MHPFILLLASAPAVAAWGALGHQLTGVVAQSQLTPTTTRALTALLGGPLDLARAATWADEIKGKAAWSKPLHYIDANDSPPTSCGVDYTRDCPDGNCVVGAIANYTQRLGSCNADAAQRAEAAKFLTHFLGDLTQPLHTCMRSRGGNDAKVTFDGRRDVALHAVWDSSIPEKRLKTTFKDDQDAYIAHLKTLVARVPTPDACLAGDATAVDGKRCAMAWAQDSSAVNCNTVWPGYDSNPSADLGGRYYEQAWPVVEQQIVKAGVRIAATFDKLLAPCKFTKPSGRGRGRRQG